MGQPLMAIILHLSFCFTLAELYSFGGPSKTLLQLRSTSPFRNVATRIDWSFIRCPVTWHYHMLLFSGRWSSVRTKNRSLILNLERCADSPFKSQRRWYRGNVRVREISYILNWHFIVTLCVLLLFVWDMKLMQKAHSVRWKLKDFAELFGAGSLCDILTVNAPSTTTIK